MANVLVQLVLPIVLFYHCCGSTEWSSGTNLNDYKDPRASGVYDLPRGIGVYKHHSEEVTYNDALAICITEGAHLAIIETYAEAAILRYIHQEYENVTGHQSPHSEFFVGCNDIVEEGVFVTINGDELLTNGYFYDWNDGEPNSFNGDEDCCALLPNGLLNDVPCSYKLPFICETSFN